MIDVVLPALNERDALPWVLTRMPPAFRPIVVDNGSTDGSGDLARDLGALVISEPRRGFGAACQRGLEAATSDVVCFMDCDGSLDPRDLPRVSIPVSAGDADLLVGARAAEPGAWPFHARVANRLLAFEIRRRWGISVIDIGPMRAAPRGALLGLGITDRRSGWPLEMLTRAIEAGWRVAQVPVSFRARSGSSKVTGTLGGTLRAIGDMGKVLL
jgi:glycosyltransferase involved in cell wall biosynthesis